MKNKKGEITLENTLTVLLAVLGLTLLFFGAYKLYQIVVSQEQENAKNFLNTIETKINNIAEDESLQFSIRGVENWFLTGWSKDDPNRPVDKIECFLDSCVCICKGDTQILKDSCNSKGFCRKIDKKEIIIIGTPVKTSGVIYPAVYIPLPKNLIELKIDKFSDKLQIILNS